MKRINQGDRGQRSSAGPNRPTRSAVWPAENSARKQRPRGKPFRKGTSGNPAGKPKGTRNRATALIEAIANDDLQTIVTKIVEKAKAGDLVAAKLIFDRVAPAPKSRAIAIELPAIGEWDGIDSVLSAYRSIIEAVTSGNVSPAEGLELVAVIEAQRAAVKELRPAAMCRKPTSKESADQQRRNEKLGTALERFRLRM